MSESWRKKGTRQLDWTTRTLVLVRRYHAQDVERVLPSELGPAGLESREAKRELPETRCYIIRRTRLAHCKKGPTRCEECRELDQERICLLDVCPANAGMRQRRVVPVVRGGRETWREFEIVRAFESVAQARKYAKEHGIDDVQL
jgi:hypothetical protein